jgi:hypothetical protein
MMMLMEMAEIVVGMVVAMMNIESTATMAACHKKEDMLCRSKPKKEGKEINSDII